MEMLGVLSIIGILSIAALFGYNYAITKYKSNTTINDLNRFVVVVTQQMLMGHDTLDLSEANNKTTLNYPATAYYLEDARYFEIALANVPPKVCQQILRENLKEPLVIKVNDYAYVGDDSICKVDDEGSPVEMVFQYVSDLDSDELPYGTCKVDADCPGNCVTCNPEGLCVSTCIGNERCAQDTSTGQMLCCPKDKREGPYCCEKKVNGRCCNKYDQCCPWYRPLIDKNGNCYTCENDNRVDVTGVQDNCNVCNNRELDGNWCRVKCTADKPLRDAYGVCRSCNDEAFIYLGHNLKQKCSTTCPNRHSSGENESFCGLKCGEGIYADMPLTDSSGVCHSCEETRNINVTNVHENCSVCPNREVIGHLCALPCPDPDKPMPGTDGKCYACDDPEPLVAAQYSCSVCPNRISFNYRCILQCGEGINANKPLLGANGDCYTCDEPKTVDVRHSSPRCEEICPNRENLNGFCIINDCDDNQMKGEDGKCYTCDTPNDARIKTQMCDKCPNRVKWRDYCILPCDEGIYEDMPLPGRFGDCFACDDPSRIDVYGATDVCQKVCPNRQLDGYHCVLNE